MPIECQRERKFGVCSSIARATGPSLCSVGFVIGDVKRAALLGKGQASHGMSLGSKNEGNGQPLINPGQ